MNSCMKDLCDSKINEEKPVATTPMKVIQKALLTSTNNAPVDHQNESYVEHALGQSEDTYSDGQKETR